MLTDRFVVVRFVCGLSHSQVEKPQTGQRRKGNLRDPVLAPDGVLQLRPVNSFVKTIFGAKGGVISGSLTPDGDRRCRPTTPHSHLECDVSKVGL